MTADRRSHPAGFGRTTLACLLLATLGACGGGGDDNNDTALSASPERTGATDGATDGNAVVQASQRLDLASLFPQVKARASQCSPDNPVAFDANGNSLAPEGMTYQKATRQKELQFIQAYMDQMYLWQAQMPQVSPDAPAYAQGNYGAAVTEYFNALRTKERLPSGRAVDRHGGIRTLAEHLQLMASDQGAGSGVTWVRGTTSTTGQVRRVAMVAPESPAAAAGVQRGDELLAFQWEGEPEVVLASLPADEATATSLDGQINAFSVVDRRMSLRLRSTAGQTRTVALRGASFPRRLVSEARTLTPPSGAGKVGYISITEFMLPLEGQMKAAMERLKAEGAQDLVVDLRYNGGGLVYQSAQLAGMVADPALSNGKLFERYVFNDKSKALERAPDSQTPFLDKTSGGAGTGTTAGQSLPNFGLRRVYVLTTQNSCSSSEGFINGLRGVGVDVVVIGDTTCGKPFVQMPQQNCGLVYMPIIARGMNARGEGNFDEGIAPSCRVADDLSRPVGGANDPLLTAALHHRQHGACPAGTAPSSAAAKSLDAEAPAMRVVRSPLQEAGILLPGVFQHGTPAH